MPMKVATKRDDRVPLRRIEERRDDVRHGAL
jgi:hypothetical protein